MPSWEAVSRVVVLDVVVPVVLGHALARFGRFGERAALRRLRPADGVGRV